MFIGFIVFLFYTLDEKTMTIKGKIETHSLIYFLSFFLGPLFGLPVGFSYIKSKNEKDRKVARICIVLSALGILFYGSLVVLKIMGISIVDVVKIYTSM